ncbi:MULTISPECIES: DUF1127 domain-containing protein [unclassified Bradyrhizobium]|uniref:DUF1127 domain-containing protein n=1 Tax=unclassified Bradyrhizobium TaxID=2631580 RepID=UPI0028E40334|nr:MULTISPECIES: DUF1127 domain-containing protein [unclassified Bradyrhizobium]
MPSTTDDPRVSAIEERTPLHHVLRFQELDERRRGPSASHPISPKPGAEIYYLARPAPDQSCAELQPVSLLRLWWKRWRERGRFARELPWIADEVLQDYGLTRDEARRLCRRPFWRA